MTVGLSIVLLSEAPSPVQLMGVALVIGGIAIATLAGNGAQLRSSRSVQAEA
jgi:drug/metabolite transporter (DMT)-like permease